MSRPASEETAAARLRRRQHEKFDAIPPPPAALVFGTPVHFISFGFGSGLARHAPGTWGTLAAVPLWLLLSAVGGLGAPYSPYYAAVCLLLFGVGCWATGESARLLRVQDYPGFVFDEIVGFLIAAAPLATEFAWLQSQALYLLPAAFLLFRVFDILKPWPIGWFDRRVHGGLGVMLDDGIAGLMVAASLFGAIRLLRLAAG